MASRAMNIARLARRFVPCTAIKSNFLGQRAAIAGYHNAKSNPPLAIPTEDNRTMSAESTQWADDGLALGDYPNLPHISYQRRQYLGWWDKQDRRNFAEPVHEDEDALNIWIWSEVESNDKYTRYEVLKHFIIAFSLLGTVVYLSFLYDAPSRNPALPREMPFNHLYLERGGDPEKDPSADKGKVPNAIFGM